VAGETAILGERLIGVSRRSATERIAHFLLELLTRLQSIGLADERSYRLPLTQEMISDVLGLSIPYVNRVLQQLREAGLVHIKDQLVVIDNFEELSALADFERGNLVTDVDDLSRRADSQDHGLHDAHVVVAESEIGRQGNNHRPRSPHC